MGSFVKKLLSESLVFELIDSMLDEDYPTHFDMEKFKSLTSFTQRIKYCEENLQRISSGSSRIVYKIDNQKVLKLAKNKKGLAQNEVEIMYGEDYLLKGTVAEIFDYEENNLWVEMELARKLTVTDFQRITEVKWLDFKVFIWNYEQNMKGRNNFKRQMDPQVEEEMWENEFVQGITDFIGNYDVTAGDLRRKNSYGIVKRDWGDWVVLIDYGLTHDVYTSYYS